MLSRGMLQREAPAGDVFAVSISGRQLALVKTDGRALASKRYWVADHAGRNQALDIVCGQAQSG